MFHSILANIVGKDVISYYMMVDGGNVKTVLKGEKDYEDKKSGYR